jgi:hypothetical protein
VVVLVEAENGEGQEDDAGGQEDGLAVLIPEQKGIESSLDDILLLVVFVGRIGIAGVGRGGHKRGITEK